MALSKALLKGMGLTEDRVSAIIELQDFLRRRCRCNRYLRGRVRHRRIIKYSQKISQVASVQLERR